MSRGDGDGEFCFNPGQRGPLGCLWCHLGCGGGVYSGRALCSKRRPKISKILATHGMAAGLSAGHSVRGAAKQATPTSRDGLREALEVV